ncbi:MAG: RsmB/NOP family class I SAM-dependent RNA methyltransferase [Alphaproteobacteria bacterium]|nr:RsmB/NOP family class I SAM-dependent RNA methyltransferase [Alphaproteobacteria bacterium SS10]
MRDGPRWQTIIDLLDQTFNDRVPADLAIRRWSKSARFAGSKDRRFIGDNLFDIFRQLGALKFQLAEAGGDINSARQIALLAAGAGAKELFDGSQHAPAAVSDNEGALLEKALAVEVPAEQAMALPDWAQAHFAASFGGDDAWRAEATALLSPASVDLRLRSAKDDRDDMLKTLGARGVDVDATPISPLGLRISGRFAAGDVPELNDGQLEIQDEASQLCALLVDAQPKMQVLDLCAGAGGKTLAMAGQMAGQGRLLAVDADDHKLEEGRRRVKRARWPHIELLHADALTAPEDALAGDWDRVLVDAPCSGSGTWRRAPDARWRMDADDLDALVELQGKLLDRAASLVKPGGLLCYVTCSMLSVENNQQIQSFMNRSSDFSVVDFDASWAAIFEDGEIPAVHRQEAGWMMTPALNGTDGFYMAVLKREA